jgi:hypothetical protein
MKRPRRRPADKRTFNPAVLVTKRYFEVIYRFTVTLETKVSRFDDAGVYRSDTDFVNLASFH